MMQNGMESDLVRAAGYGPPGGGPPGYGPPGGGPPMGGPPGYGPPPGGPPGYGPPPGGGFGPPPGGFGPPGGPPGGMMMGPGGQKFHALAITSMILGILSIPSCCCWFLGAPMAVAGLVLGIVGLGKIRQQPQLYKGGGMAIAGIVCAGVAILLDLVAIFSTIDDNLKSQYGGGF